MYKILQGTREECEDSLNKLDDEFNVKVENVAVAGNNITILLKMYPRATNKMLECPLCHGSTMNLLEKQVDYDNSIIRLTAKKLAKAIKEKRACFASDELNDIVKMCINSRSSGGGNGDNK